MPFVRGMDCGWIPTLAGSVMDKDIYQDIIEIKGQSAGVMLVYRCPAGRFLTTVPELRDMDLGRCNSTCGMC